MVEVTQEEPERTGQEKRHTRPSSGDSRSLAETRALRALRTGRCDILTFLVGLFGTKTAGKPILRDKGGFSTHSPPGEFSTGPQARRQ